MGPRNDLGDVKNPNAIYVKSSSELQAALNNLKSGDTIVLKTANYGDLSVLNKNLTIEAEIRADVGATPLVQKIVVNNSKYIKINGLKVRPVSKDTAVNLNGSYLTVENLDIAFSDNSSSWSLGDWNTKPGNGINGKGDNIKIYNNLIKNINFGIANYASFSHVKNNIVDYFAGDGLRALGDNSLWENNLVTNNINVNDNHDDGLQTWTVGPNGVGTGVQSNLIIRGNTIIETTDSSKPFPGPLQGIGLFDGTFKNFLIEDNVVIVNHWHGISVYGAEDVTIRYNTVIDNDPSDNMSPWIKINNHKNKTAPVNCRVEYNLANSYSSESVVTQIGNKTIKTSEFDSYFVDWQKFDLHLKDSAPAKNVGVRF